VTSERFADLLRLFAQNPTRRAFGRAIAGSVFGGALGISALLEVPGKRKRHKKKKKCKGGKKKCGKKCFDLQTDPAHCGSCGNACDESEVCLGGTCGCPVDEPACGGACCAPANCIDGACCQTDRTCGTVCCAADEVCGKPEAGLCVVGQGTCPSGADSCDGNAVICNSPETCGCFQSVSGATRCGQGTVDTQCGQCTNDAACEGILGEPGAFCARFFGSSCPSCEEGQNACFVPCPG
jgi:hypothetical protein